MKAFYIVSILLLAISGSAFAEQLCGKLSGECLNGGNTCRQFITPSYCLNGPGTCHQGQAVAVRAENQSVAEDMSSLIETRVCAEGAKNGAGIFIVSSVSAEQ